MWKVVALNAKKYVMGIYKSLDIYDKACAPSGTASNQIISAFVNKAKANKRDFGWRKNIMAQLMRSWLPFLAEALKSPKDNAEKFKKAKIFRLE